MFLLPFCACLPFSDIDQLFFTIWSESRDEIREFCSIGQKGEGKGGEFFLTCNCSCMFSLSELDCTNISFFISVSLAFRSSSDGCSKNFYVGISENDVLLELKFILKISRAVLRSVSGFQPFLISSVQHALNENIQQRLLDNGSQVSSVEENNSPQFVLSFPSSTTPFVFLSVSLPLLSP